MCVCVCVCVCVCTVSSAAVLDENFFLRFLAQLLATAAVCLFVFLSSRYKMNEGMKEEEEEEEEEDEDEGVEGEKRREKERTGRRLGKVRRRSGGELEVCLVDFSFR